MPCLATKPNSYYRNPHTQELYFAWFDGRYFHRVQQHMEIAYVVTPPVLAITYERDQERSIVFEQDGRLLTRTGIDIEHLTITRLYSLPSQAELERQQQEFLSFQRLRKLHLLL